MSSSPYKTLRFRITGVAPLIMHNGVLADPLSSQSKSLAELNKRKKTDAEHAELARREFVHSLYLENGKPILTNEMLLAGLIQGAKKKKRGPAAKAGLLVEEHAQLEYDGPHDALKLWQDLNFRLRVRTRVGQSAIMRTRPIFHKWAAAFVVKFLPELLNAEEIGEFLTIQGNQIGIGDWRPRHGRFTVKQLS
jgi:hypothetical protein